MRRNSDIEIQLSDIRTTGPADSSIDPDVDMLSDESSAPLTLPPHIAARFYRKSSAGRCLPATSTRRSSVSSLHSSPSTHNGSHSDHVAQHLRRASILENRKARLADRALHVEKVRLRAALAKATKNGQSERRALAAQQTRERFLAEITAKCEEEVRRAKKKAEDNRERKAAEHARLRLEIEEKFAEAEKRRLIYLQTQRRPRTSSIPSAEEKKLTQRMAKSLSRDAAARRIQRAWRMYHSNAVMREFQLLSISVERICAMSFEDVGALLAQENVLDTMARVLRLCTLQNMESGTMGERGAVRTFLSSYLIVSHPSAVFNSDGELERDLIIKAREFLAAFEQVTSLLSSRRCSPSVISSDLQALVESYNVFFSAFHSWKTKDSSILIEIMLAQFVELELIWQTVKDDHAGGVAEDYREGIRHNQILLLARLKRLAGSGRAIQMVRDALKAKREKKRTTSKHAIPRSAEAAPASSAEVLTESAPFPISEPFVNAENPRLTELDEHHVPPHEHFTKMLTALPENRALVHELLIDREFKIDEVQYTEPRKQIMAHMCASMRQGIAKGMDANWTISMATVIQDRLLRLLRPGNSLHVLISEVLDPKLLKNQSQAGTFSYDNFFDFMKRILPKLCAPYRDPVVKAFAEDTSGDVIDRLAQLMGIIDLLSLDHTNFMIQVAAPQLIQEAPGYEQRAFKKGLRDGYISLEKTQRFWRINHKAIVEELRKRDPENIHGEPQPPAAKTYAHGLADLVLSNNPVSVDFIPETLGLDRQRLEKLHSKAFKIVATGTILLTAKNLLKRDVRSQWKAEAERIASLDFTEIGPERIQTILESTHPMPSTASAQLAATIKRVLVPAATASAASERTLEVPQALLVEVRTESPAQDSSWDDSASPSSQSSSLATGSAATSFSDPVARLLLSRLRTHVLSRLSASSASERVRATTTASQSLAGAGLPEFVNEVGKLVEEMEKIREVDWLCHGEVYERLLEEGLSRDAALAQTQISRAPAS